MDKFDFLDSYNIYELMLGVSIVQFGFSFSECFFSDFEKINSISLPVLVFDLKEGVPVIVISLDDVSYCDVLDEMDIDFMKCDSLAELLTSDKLDALFKD